MTSRIITPTEVGAIDGVAETERDEAEENNDDIADDRGDGAGLGCGEETRELGPAGELGWTLGLEETADEGEAMRLGIKLLGLADDTTGLRLGAGLGAGLEEDGLTDGCTLAGIPLDTPDGNGAGLDDGGLIDDGLTEEGLTSEGLFKDGLTGDRLTTEGLTNDGLTGDTLGGEDGLTGDGLATDGLTADTRADDTLGEELTDRESDEDGLMATDREDGKAGEDVTETRADEDGLGAVTDGLTLGLALLDGDTLGALLTEDEDAEEITPALLAEGLA